MSLRSLFLDFDAYFASCEQHLQPALRGKPVGVFPAQSNGGTCIAVSYQARKCGIRVGTKVVEARRLCPEIVVVPSRPDDYVRLHHQLINIINDCMYVEKVFSIDEMSCPLTGRWRKPRQALALARQIKARLAEFSPALTCSIGIAPNTWLGKVGTEMQKPNGLVILCDEDLPHALYELKLTDLPMIAEGMAARLAQNDVHTVEQLCALSRPRMRDIWGGVEGERFHVRLHGGDLPAVETTRNHIGHSRVLPPDRRNAPGVRATLFRLMQRAAIRLRAEGYYAQKISMQVKFYGAPSVYDEVTLPPIQETPIFIDALARLWARIPPDVFRQHQAKACSVIFTDLESVATYTPSLFQQEERRGRALAQALDQVTRSYGQKSLYFGCAHGGFDEVSATRIAFNRVPDLSFEN